jgi:Icc protein
MSSDSIRIAIVTDVHHGPHSHTKQEGWDALPVLDEFVAFATREGADLMLDLGDRISDTTRDADLVAEGEVIARLSRFIGPRLHLLGNHDVAMLTAGDNEGMIGQPVGSRSFDLGAVRIIAFQPDVHMIKPTGFRPVAEQDLAWLVDALRSDERPAVIASHLPFSGHAQVGNYYFENNQRFSTYPNHAEVRAAVEGTGRAAMWLSGHVHWTTLTTIQGIHHISLHSLSETFTTTPEAAAAYALLEISGAVFNLTVHGNEPLHVRGPFRPSGDRPWLPPLGPFWS